jgi:predicted metal-dependent enzyme (double-stranded beta helix superfamily)
MKMFQKCKDGGDNSHVTAYTLIEIKSLFSIILLKFAPGTRDAYHSHAFNAVTWILRGKFIEQNLYGPAITYVPSLRPKITLRATFHKVFSVGKTWAITFRGPWKDQWHEFVGGKLVSLTHGRKVIG